MMRVMVVRTSLMVRTCLRWEGPAILLADGDSVSDFKARTGVLTGGTRGWAGGVDNVCLNLLTLAPGECNPGVPKLVR